MRIGYPCLNRSIGCTSSRTFRLKSYTEELLIQTVSSNLDCLKKTLLYNAARGILFFRISSDLVPFASHPVCKFDWQSYFKDRLSEIGALIRAKGMRISMHPDQFTLINSIDEKIFDRSSRELLYHAEILDLMGLDTSAKIQIHVGGVYNDREESLRRFIRRFGELDNAVARRLVVENDERYPVADCLRISREAGLPVLFDVFHHSVSNKGESIPRAFAELIPIWDPNRDGIAMVDYSSQLLGGRPGMHAHSIDEGDFLSFLSLSMPHDFDLMLEIKDKEKSALRALELASHDPRLSGPRY
ncbi:MAG: UV DNA damage repair endonuclease UvsE [Candidatus Methanosuratincola sp.]